MNPKQKEIILVNADKIECKDIWSKEESLKLKKGVKFSDQSGLVILSLSEHDFVGRETKTGVPVKLPSKVFLIKCVERLDEGIRNLFDEKMIDLDGEMFNDSRFIYRKRNAKEIYVKHKVTVTIFQFNKRMSPSNYLEFEKVCIQAHQDFYGMHPISNQQPIPSDFKKKDLTKISNLLFNPQKTSIMFSIKELVEIRNIIRDNPKEIYTNPWEKKTPFGWVADNRPKSEKGIEIHYVLDKDDLTRFKNGETIKASSPYFYIGHALDMRNRLPNKMNWDAENYGLVDGGDDWGCSSLQVYATRSCALRVLYFHSFDVSEVKKVFMAAHKLIFEHLPFSVNQSHTKYDNLDEDYIFIIKDIARLLFL